MRRGDGTWPPAVAVLCAVATCVVCEGYHSADCALCLEPNPMRLIRSLGFCFMPESAALYVRQVRPNKQERHFHLLEKFEGLGIEVAGVVLWGALMQGLL